DGTGTGLAGAAHIAVDSPGNQVLSFAASFTGQVEGLFDLDTASTLSAIGNLFGDLAVQVEASPTAELTTFVDQIGAVDGAANGDFLATLQHALDTINAIRDGVPPDHSAIVSALLDQILAVLGSLSGPEADAIQAWIQSLAGMQARLAPLIAAAQSAPNPETLAIEVVQHVVDNFLGRLGFDEIQRFVAFLDDFPGNALAPDLLTELSGSLDVVTGAYGDLQGVVDADWPQFRATAVAAIDTMHAMEDKLRAVLEIVERIAGAKIFQPHALEGYLREQFEQALAIPVQDVQQIDGPYNALLDRIDAAIEGIDLTFISDDISNFFTDTRTAIEQANIGGVGELLQSQLAVVSNAVDTLQQGVTDLLTRIQAFFDNLLAQARSLTESFGTFLPDGSFQYDFQDELSELFNRARLALAGDPANPGAASLTTSLDQFQSTIDQFLNQLSGLL
ncbi:MAG: hypothetical protein KDE58_31025, partial [Caldilineaceae bacterium]|nr:hypothetical protein [Caldilineaceae bacterium]